MGRKIDFARRLGKYIGLSTASSNALISAVTKFMIQDLRARGSVYLRNIGEFSVTKRERTRIKFVPADNFRHRLKQDFQLNLDSENQYRILAKEEQDRVANLIIDLENPIVSPSKVSRHFAYYLKNTFPGGKSWKHPITRRKYTAKEVKSALEFYKKLEPDKYVELWTLWVSPRARRDYLELKDITLEDMVYTWYEILESVLFILLYPELKPARIRAAGAASKSVKTPVIKQSLLDKYLAPFRNVE